MTADTYAVLTWMRDNLTEGVAVIIGRGGEKYVLSDRIRQYFIESASSMRSQDISAESVVLHDLLSSVLTNVDWNEVAHHLSGAVAVEFNEDEWEKRLKDEVTTQPANAVDFRHWGNRETWQLSEWLLKTPEWAAELCERARANPNRYPEYVRKYVRTIIDEGLSRVGPVFKPLIEVALQRVQWTVLANAFRPEDPKSNSLRDVTKHFYSKGGE